MKDLLEKANKLNARLEDILKDEDFYSVYEFSVYYEILHYLNNISCLTENEERAIKGGESKVKAITSYVIHKWDGFDFTYETIREVIDCYYDYIERD